MRAPAPRTDPAPVVAWWEPHRGSGLGVIAYRGRLAGRPGVRMRYGFDGWRNGPHEAVAEQHSPEVLLARIDGVDSASTVDLAITDGTEWDNNHGADYRLWTTLTPIDSHLHAASAGLDRLGLEALRIGLASAGILRGVISWRDNPALDRLVGDDGRFRRLVWVNPAAMEPREVQERLANGHAGLKLHPAVDDYPADDSRLDPYLEVARSAGTPVAVHSGPGNADPSKIARLARRFPEVTFVLYHTYLGVPWGRRRAAHHARSQSNLVLETSWCRWGEVERLVEDIGAERVMFGSDAAIDGPYHFSSRNVEGRESYKEIMLRIAEGFGREAAGMVLGDNARRLFGMAADRVTEG